MKTSAGSERSPEVILDFIFQDGLFFISIHNLGDGPAHNVSVRFNKKFTGPDGVRELSSLRLFRKIPFLAPRKAITVFLDTSASYFRRRQPTDLSATITFLDGAANRLQTVVRHDLAIYRDIPCVRIAPPDVTGE